MYRWIVAALLVVLVTLAALSEQSRFTAHAAVTIRVWTGAVNLNWSTPGNWDPPGPPADGDSVVIGSVASGKILVNDAGPFDVVNNRALGINLSSLTITTRMTIVGNPIGIAKAFNFESANGLLELRLTVVLRSDVELAIPNFGSFVLVGTEPPTVGQPALITDGHTLTKTGAGALTFWGDISGTGSVVTQKGVTGVAYPLTLSGVLSVAAGAQLGFGTRGPAGSLCGSAPKSLLEIDGLFTMSCPTSVGGLAGSGTVSLNKKEEPLQIVGREPAATFAGNLSNAQFGGAIICCSAGEQTFSGLSYMFGYVTVTAGSMFLAGATFAVNAAFTVQGGAGFRPTLGGFGTFGPTIITDGNLALDSVKGAFGLARFPTLQLAPTTTVTFEIKGPTPGTDFTQVVVSGETFLDNALLSVDFNGYALPVGQSLTLLKGGSASFDTFRNAADSVSLPEGATFTVDGMKFTISYKGGTGRDVIITRLASGPSVTPTPSATPTATPTPTSTPKPSSQFKRILPMVSSDK